MSREGWRGFLEADGVDDWVVLHGGATAAFRAASLVDASRLAVAISGVDGLEPGGAVLIVVLTALGMASWLIGLVPIVPWLAHASWHAYRDCVVPAAEGSWTSASTRTSTTWTT